MQQDKLYFLSGLPRSGSTLLGAILSQNPLISASASSPLVGLLWAVDQMWKSAEHVRAHEEPGQRLAVMRGMIDNFYGRSTKPIIIDKNRAWPEPTKQTMIAEILGEHPKIIATVRPIADVLASFIILINRNPNSVSFVDKELIRKGIPRTMENRVHELMGKDGHLFQSWTVLEEGYKMYPGNILFIEYDMLVLQPMIEMMRIYRFLGLPEFNHRFDDIKNPTPENDELAYGLPGMHDVRSYLLKTSPNARQVLGDTIYKYYQGGEFWKK